MTSEQDDVNFSVPETDGIDDSQVMSRVPRELSTIAEVSDTELSVSSPTTNIEKPINIYLNEKESDKEDSTEEDITLELPEFDWSDFENRFTEALQLLDTEESHILDQFDQLMEMFFIWAQTGSSCETERAVKRLKTRERYVQLSEESLEQKKAHYVQVVSAFKAALDMLR